MRKGYKRWLAILMLVFTLFVQTACGQQELPYHMGENQGEGSGSETGGDIGDNTKEIKMIGKTSDDVFQAKDMVTQVMWYSYAEMKLWDDMLCYGSGTDVCRNALREGAVKTDKLVWEDAPGEKWGIEHLCFDGEGNLYAYTWVKVKKKMEYYLCKFDLSGNLTYAVSLDSHLEEDSIWNSNWEMVADGMGNLYFGTESRIVLFDAEGVYQKDVSFDGAGTSVFDMVATKEGVVYLLYGTNGGLTQNIGEIDFASGKVINNAKSSGMKGLAPGMDTLLLAYDTENLYAYDVAAGEMEQLFVWNDCDINGQDVWDVDVASDGRLVVISYSSSAGNISLIKRMTAQEAAAIPPKQEIVIGLFGKASKSLAQALVYFNKESDKYRISTRNYASDCSVAEGIDTLNKEIAAGKGPDILEAGALDVEHLAKMGLFENLNDYIERSENFTEDDFVKRLVEFYTVDGKLVAMPHSFTLNTYMGSSDLVGEEMGWTLDEMLEFIKANPEKQILHDATKGTMLNVLMRFNEYEFIDWETGECRFDTEEFMTLMELVNTFPNARPADGSYAALVPKLAGGEVVLMDLFLDNFINVQPFTEIFEYNYTYIGYPNSDGIGCECMPKDVMTISSQSDCKEGAWEFLEYFYRYRAKGTNLFSCLQEILEENAREHGLHFTEHQKMYSSTLDYTYRDATREEIDRIFELIEGMQLTDMNMDVFFIIKEEIQAYFKDQKSIEEVAQIIQSRVQIYVDENR